MKVSVVIPTYNRAAMVERCVRSVLASDWKGEALEVIVVDDCSPDDTSPRLSAAFGADARVKLLRNARNSFQAVSRNSGAAVATGDALLFLDDDNEVAPSMIRELAACFDRHPRAVLVAPVAIHRRTGGEGLVWTLGSDFNRYTSQPRDLFPNLPEGRIPADRCDYPTTYSPNAFMVKAAAFREAGGFDETLVQTFEESDFGWRLMEAGGECYITTRAVTSHFGFLEPGCAPVLRRLGIEKTARSYYFARNRIRFARRHFGAVQALCVAFAFAPLSALYYGFTALRHRRPDIALAYAKGTLRGILGLA